MNRTAPTPFILVTGGTGFLGAYLLSELISKGYRVRAIKRANSAIPFFISSKILDQVEWVEGDVLDIGSIEDALQGITTVIHSAAIVSFQAEDREKMYATNVQGTANIVNLCIEAGIERVVHISSVAAIGRTNSGEWVSEEKKWVDSSINTHYAITKHKAEMEMWRGMAEGLSGVIVNPSTILGFGNWNSSSCALFKQVHGNFPWFTKGVNGFIFVEDAARAIVQLMESSLTLERYILNGENWSFEQLLKTMAAGLKSRPPYKEATPLMAELAWRMEKLKAVFTGNRPLLSKESAKIAQSITRFDNRKLLNEFPDFRYTSLEDAILESCGRYLQHYSR